MMDKNIDNYYMHIALNEAKKAYKNGDTPIGCIIVYNGSKKNKKMTDCAIKRGIETDTILAKSYNKRNKNKNAISHAEILAISKACKKIDDFRLEECTMYVTLEPCQMCAGAIVQSRIKRLVIGAKSKKSGSCGSIINILDNNEFNHKVICDYIDDKSSAEILVSFFKEIRNGRRK